MMSSMNGDRAGRWRAGSVAVKIINHDKHVGNNFDAMRESVLCSNINHPNVVMTYKASLRCPSSWYGYTSYQPHAFSYAPSPPQTPLQLFKSASGT